MEPALNLLLDDADDARERGEDIDELLYVGFHEWAESTGRPLYSFQDEALAALLTGAHAIVATPTGSGKSLVAAAAILVALARGERAYYTAPIKALVSEKFFDLVRLFGAANVGMVTGDGSVNGDAPIICCTAEILANQALREGDEVEAGTVVMDEFHFYSEPDRGWAWQVPLLELSRPQFVLMSATLGDTSFFAEDLERRTGRETVTITSAERPVPLTFEYSVTALPDVLMRLVKKGKAPAYVVHFSQREAVERAQSLTSIVLTDKPHRERLAKRLSGFRFGPGFGATLSRLLRLGIGVHHAGMLPRYRRLVEQLAQEGMLPVICGTDTLGVGINVPIRTVVLTALTKYDGERVRHLSVREFHQVAGRAGRAGFDTEGTVVVQAPEHVIENAKALARAGDDERKRRKIVRKKAPEGQVNWTEATFGRLRDSEPERLVSQFRVSHAMVLDILARPGDPVEHLARLLTDTHDPPADWNPHLRQAAHIYRALRQAGVVEHLTTADAGDGPRLRLAVEVPDRFALNSPLSPFALAAITLLDPDSSSYSLDVVSVIESTLENPNPVLYAQRNAAKGEAVAAMKADGLDYEERMEALEDVTWPEPLADMLHGALASYIQTNPWAIGYELRPKSIVREMIEHAMTFTDLISRYQLGRSEGVVLRYLSDAYRALTNSVPAEARTPELAEITDWLAGLVRAVDSSLLDEWAALNAAVDGPDTGAAAGGRGEPGEERAFGADDDGNVAITANPHAFRISVRNALMDRIEELAREDYASLGARDEALGWPADRWRDAIDPYWREHDWLGTGPEARAASMVKFDSEPDDAAFALASLSPAPGTWIVRQRLDDPAGDGDWFLSARVDLASSAEEGSAVVGDISLGEL
ncbi:MAG TPA: DUF3516 domain-containing protein [Actinomycetaceae bacterium]|nr:DUF3516 domain-containing protein [Actinomycetaceae bacterium]